MLLILNLKMNLSKDTIINYEKNINYEDVIVLPQYPYLPFFSNKKYKLGAQDVSEHIKGSYTGEVCAKCLKDIGCSYCLVSHRERELYFNETSKTTKNKINNLIKNNITPIYCINEMYKDNNIDSKIRNIPKEVKEIIIAYEPVWLIGKELTKKDIKRIVESISKIKNKLDKKKINYKLVYGGGINKNNVSLLIDENIVDGFILSSSCLDIESFKELYNIINC